MKYDFTAIEAKWHKIWDEKQLYAARTGSDAKKFYALAEYLLLTPGPLTTSESVKTAMMTDWCTWDEDYMFTS